MHQRCPSFNLMGLWFCLNVPQSVQYCQSQNQQQQYRLQKYQRQQQQQQHQQQQQQRLTNTSQHTPKCGHLVFLLLL